MRKALMMIGVVGAILAPAAAQATPAGLSAAAPAGGGPLLQAAQHYCFGRAARPQEVIDLAKAEGFTQATAPGDLTADETYSYVLVREAGPAGPAMAVLLSDGQLEIGGRNYPVSTCTTVVDGATGAGVREDTRRYVGLAPNSDRDGQILWIVKPVGGRFETVHDDDISLSSALKDGGQVLGFAVQDSQEPVIFLYVELRPLKD